MAGHPPVTADFLFKRELAGKLEGALAALCYQCGACAGDCPAATYSATFNPRVGDRVEVTVDDDALAERGLTRSDIVDALDAYAAATIVVAYDPAAAKKLLAEAEQTDPAGRMLNNYLTSESGRVYLLLAHASGRLR